MRTRFYIEKRKDTTGKLISTGCPVFMSVTFGGERIIIGTGVKVDMNGWDPDLQKVHTSYLGFRNLNNALESLQKIAVKTMEALNQSGNEVSSAGFRHLFQQLKPRKSSGFFDLFYQFMESNSSSWSSSTYRKVRTLYNLLREFEDQTGYSISFQNLNAQFLERYVKFCSEKGYKQSTIYKTVNNLVWFLNWSTQNGYNVFREYKQFYKLMDSPKQNSQMPLFLSWDELMRLKEYTTVNRKMERVRDLFCFMCFAGLRFTELQNLKKEDMKPGEVVVRKPGGGVRFIPMNKYAEPIHKKYENKFYLNNTAFPSMSIITMNKYLRLIGEDLGLTNYKSLTAGIAVNTFIRNALEMDVPVEIIAWFTGVQNDSRVRKIKSDLAAEEMKKFSV